MLFTVAGKYVLLKSLHREIFEESSESIRSVLHRRLEVLRLAPVDHRSGRIRSVLKWQSTN